MGFAAAVPPNIEPVRKRLVMNRMMSRVFNMLPPLWKMISGKSKISKYLGQGN
jgi:hypothetical protein